MIQLKVVSKSKGPMLDGSAGHILDAGILQASAAVAQAGVNLVRSDYKRVLKNPSGHLESRVTTDLSSATHPAVTDGGVVYGPWIEGVSSRNTRSRFKGYQTYRRMTQKLSEQSAGITSQALQTTIVKIGG